MRHLKGTIVLSETWDLPLMRRVLHCGLVTREQLYEFLKLDCSSPSHKSFSDRLRRLVHHGMVSCHELRIVNHGSVYSVTLAGASELIGRGEYYMRQPSSLAGLGKRLHHTLELNEIHLALKRTGALVRWTPESEIRSSNELTSRGYEKDYDAVITVRVDERECCFALEYERSPKDRSRYKEIQEKIERETRVHHFLYLCPRHDLLMFVMNRFLGCKRAVHFGLSMEFLTETLNLQVQSIQSPISMMLRSVLRDGRITESECAGRA